MRDRRPLLLLGLGEAALGRHALARLRAAPRADADRRRDRLRLRAPARAHRPPVRQVRAADRHSLGTPLHDSEPGALPDPRAVHRHHLDDCRGRARLVHARDPLPQHRRRVAERAGRRDRSRARDGSDAAAGPLARRAAARDPGDRRRPARGRRLDDRDRHDRRDAAPEGPRLPDPARAEVPDPVQDRDLHGRAAGRCARARRRPAARRTCAACSCRGSGGRHDDAPRRRRELPHVRRRLPLHRREPGIPADEGLGADRAVRGRARPRRSHRAAHRRRCSGTTTASRRSRSAPRSSAGASRASS